MANSQLVTASISNTFSDNTTNYVFAYGSNNDVATETSAQCPVRDAGTLSNLFVKCRSNTTLVTTTITTRQNAGNTSLVVTYGSGETGVKEDTSNSVSLANTDEIDYRVAVANDASGATTINLTVFATQFASSTSSNSVSFFGGTSSSSVFNNASTTVYNVASGGFSQLGGTTEAPRKYRCRFSFTSSNLYTISSANARTSTTTIRTRKNGGNGTQSVSYGSTETGVKEDTSNTDSLSVGDDYNYSVTTGTGTNNITMHFCGTTLVGTASLFGLLSGSTSDSSVAFNATVYNAIAGGNLTTPTESRVQMYPRFDFTAKELLAYVVTNTIATSASTATLRDNGSDSSVTVSYAAAETGLKNDTTNTATITAGSDEINYVVVTPNTSGSIEFTQMGILGETASASTFVPKVMMM